MKTNENEVKVTEQSKEPYTAPLLTQHEPLRSLTGQSKTKEGKDTID